MYKANGCDVCGGSGYKGRCGLHELLVGTDPMKKLIQEHARVAEMLATALAEGMLTLKMDGMEKVLMGITDMLQVRGACINGPRARQRRALSSPSRRGSTPCVRRPARPRPRTSAARSSPISS